MKINLSSPPEKPINVVIHEKTQNSITVGWKAGLNGGYPQHFKVFYREKGKKIWKESQDSISGLKTGQSTNYTISGLYAGNEYEITVAAINQFMDRTVSEAAVQMVIFGEIKDAVKSKVKDAASSKISKKQNLRARSLPHRKGGSSSLGMDADLEDSGRDNMKSLTF